MSKKCPKCEEKSVQKWGKNMNYKIINVRIVNTVL